MPCDSWPSDIRRAGRTQQAQCRPLGYTRPVQKLSLTILAVLTAACTRVETIVPDGLIHPECSADAWIEVVPLDIWGRTVTDASITGSTTGEQQPILVNEDMAWEIAVDGLIGASLTATWSGGRETSALTVTATGATATAVSMDVLNVDERGCMVFTVFVGLDHPWFAASSRAPDANNKVTLLMDGEEQWRAFYEDLTTRPDPIRVHQSTWWWMSSFELIRDEDHADLTPEERQASTMMALLRQRPGYNRVLVARFAENLAPGMAYLNTDQVLRDRGREPDDDFEVMLQGNPVLAPFQGEYSVPTRPFSFVKRVRANPMHAWRTFHEPVGQVQAPLVAIEAASYHQKAAAIDGAVAYVSGMNVKSTDWDTNDHRLFDHKRMRFEATEQERLAVKKRLAMPDQGPRKDYGVRIEGPTARDVDDVLRVRWEHGLQTGAMFSEGATSYELLPPAEGTGTVTAQVVATMPDPLSERGILETLLKASRQATDLIYIEDQYWRAPILQDAIAAALDENPDLHMVVITKPVPIADGGKKYTVLGDDFYRNNYPDRYLVLQLKVFDRRDNEVFFQNMDVHSKIQIVDDVYLCVGSANKNNRGLLYEGELNVAVHDPNFVTAARNRILINLVGENNAAAVVGRTGREVFAFLRSLATANAAVEASLIADPAAEGEPSGFVYPLAFEPGWLLEVGPDVF